MNILSTAETITKIALSKRAPLKPSALLLTLMLAACGGSSDESPQAVDQASTNEPASTATDPTDSSTGKDSSSDQNAEPISDTNAQNANDDVIATDFDFRAVTAVGLSIDVSQVSDTKSYVSLCHYKTEAKVDLNYEDCLLRGSTSFGEFSGEFDAAPHFEQLGLAVWFTDTSIQPLMYQISRADMELGAVNIIAKG